MKIALRRRPNDDVRALWLLAISLLFAGGYFIEARYERAIAASHERTEALYRRMVSNQRIVRESAAVSRMRDRARHDLEQVSHDASLSATTAAVVLMLGGSAARYGIAVTGVEPGPPANEHAWLSSSPLTIKLHGRFRNTLQFIADLPRHRTLISVSETQIALADEDVAHAAPQLDATVRATLYRLRMPAQKRGKQHESDL